MMHDDETRIARRSSLNIPAIKEVQQVEPELSPLIPADWEFDLPTKHAYTSFVEGLVENLVAAMVRA